MKKTLDPKLILEGHQVKRELNPFLFTISLKPLHPVTTPRRPSHTLRLPSRDVTRLVSLSEKSYADGAREGGAMQLARPVDQLA